MAQERVFNASMYKKVEIFSKGDLLYLLAPHAPSPKTGIAKFHCHYIGLLVTDTVLDSTHNKLRDLGNRVWIDTLSHNRLKLLFVSTPAGTVIIQQQLNKTFQSINGTKIIADTASHIISIHQ